MKKEKIIYKGDGIRIDKYIPEVIDKLTRSQVQSLISENLITVNDKKVKANYILKANDEIIVSIPQSSQEEVIPQNIPLDIIYEDKDIIVVNKKSGMVIHPAAGNYENTLVNALLYHYQDLSDLNGPKRPGIVHRIDKDTSGLIVVCRNNFAHENIAKQFFDKKVVRKYLAICSGVIPHNLGKIDAPIARNPNNRQQMAVVETGKEAITHFKVLERFQNHTLLELQLETGRTHQIRVHMKYIGYPVTGDPIYGFKKETSQYGQFLHAKTIGFYHPRTNKFIEFDSDIPSYFQKYLNELKA